ncbi:hypothetical protein SMACR_05109 [Sordaria macrospora]|uniref:WGS project CABT00000000 data, contig 2.22 n=2 Tax=Sordaria macrospora TaxID=5147 RepID=F7W2P6_SORMK|nr:uncharacterized protein SMAC_05109 [Sordaria macrospora k-hell]KAA8632027.1 hypothetical protein SMACR_05109 [Sordaria macrospora]WPJ61000.1 hypothetical protein SMAC4_05109 [Sordaria macrospora]CCC11897.1 unnamed protein product [Sordaria macrospora k-hell]
MAQPSVEDVRRQNGLIIASAVMIAVAVLFVLLRCVSRFILIQNPGPDDYFIIAAMALTLGYLINLVVLTHNGIGMAMSTLTLDNMVNFLKITLAIQVMYYANVFCIKVSILFTYIRFAVTRTFRYLCIGTIILHIVFLLVCVITTLAQCQPLHKMWDFTGAVEGTCINTTAFFYFTSAFNILTDLWILLLPISTLREINRPTREKIALFLIFGVGTFAAVASIVRLHTIYIYTLAEDPFHEGINVNLWSMIEVTIAISCASVSALKPIFSGRQRRLTRGARGGRGGGYTYGSYGTGTWTGADNTAKGNVSGSGGRRSTGTWFKKSKGSNGLDTQSSEDGLHAYGEEAELQKLGSRADSHRNDQAEREKEKEFTQGHKEYRRWVHSSHSRLGSRDSQNHHHDQQPHHGRQHSRQHSRQQSSLSSPNGHTQNLPTPDGDGDTSSISISLPIQRPKPAAAAIGIAVAINQTRPLSPPPPPLSPSFMPPHMSYQHKGQQPYLYKTSRGDNHLQGHGRWVEVETADTRTVYTQGEDYTFV